MVYYRHRLSDRDVRRHILLASYRLSITPLGRVALNTNVVTLRRHRIILQCITQTPQTLHDVLHTVRRERKIIIPISTLANDITHLYKYNLVKVH